MKRKSLEHALFVNKLKQIIAKKNDLRHMVPV